MPSISELPLYELGLFIFIAVLGLGLAFILRLPLPYLLGPMCLSIIFHLMGWADLPRINEFVILAQLAIGGAIGARLAKVPFQEVFGYLKDAFITTVLILSLFFIILCMALFIGSYTSDYTSDLTAGGCNEIP